MKKDIKGFSIVVALGLVVLINLLALSILDYIIPFSKDTKNIENSVVSYYQADSAIEDALFYLNENEFKPGTEGLSSTGSEIGREYNITASGSVLPPIFSGDSEYDNNWNQIAIGNPIQLEVGYNNVNFTNALFAFRVPNLNNPNNLILSGSSTTPIINWQLSSGNNSINATGSYIFSNKDSNNHICGSLNIFTDCDLSLGNFQGVDLDGNELSDQKIGNFYSNYCSSSGCILKFSIINKLETTTGINIPYLEWRFTFNTKTPPLRYSIINTTGKSYGFKKYLNVRIPQQATNQAFDFTVFQ